MLRGFATINYWAADLPAAKEWYSELLSIDPYFERAELAGSSDRMTLTTTGPAWVMSSSASATTSTSWD